MTDRLRDREMTIDEVAAELGIHRSRVHQLERAGLAKMRAACEALGIEPGDVVDAWRMLGCRRVTARGGA